ncbi:MAG: hypothetical protein DRI77_14355 [Chloroflexi bacterium]|nr:MAG: hypothetical protein DRI77_14355 [Chloroflexota bacterium]
MKSKLPFRRQEHPYSCTVACLRMLLAYHGVEMDEAELRHRCKTREFGTYARNVVACARELGFTATIEHLSLVQLRPMIDQGVFPIAYINMFPTSLLPYVHTVIVENYGTDWLLLVDPNTGPWEIREADFLEAWGIHGNMALVLRMVVK